MPPPPNTTPLENISFFQKFEIYQLITFFFLKGKGHLISTCNLQPSKQAISVQKDGIQLHHYQIGNYTQIKIRRTLKKIFPFLLQQNENYKIRKLRLLVINTEGIQMSSELFPHLFARASLRITTEMQTNSFVQESTSSQGGLTLAQYLLIQVCNRNLLFQIFLTYVTVMIDTFLYVSSNSSK